MENDSDVSLVGRLSDSGMIGLTIGGCGLYLPDHYHRSMEICQLLFVSLDCHVLEVPALKLLETFGLSVGTSPTLLLS